MRVFIYGKCVDPEDWSNWIHAARQQQYGSLLFCSISSKSVLGTGENVNTRVETGKSRQ